MISCPTFRLLLPIGLTLVFSGCSAQSQPEAVVDPTAALKALGVSFSSNLKNEIQTIRSGDHKLGDEDFLVIADLGSLKEIHAEAPGLTEKGFAAISALKKLQIVSVSGSTVTAKDIAAVATLPELRQLDLPRSRSIDDASIAVLKEHPTLESLDLSDTGLTDGSLDILLTIPNLKSLRLIGTGITDKGLAKLSAATQLQHLALGSELITDAGVTLLSANSELLHLEIVGTKVTDDSMQALAALSKLRLLRLTDNSALTDLGICRLGTLPALTELGVSGTGFSGSGCGESGFQALIALEANRSKVADSNIPEFSSMQSLNSLRLQGTTVTEPGVRKVFAANHHTQVAIDPVDK